MLQILKILNLSMIQANDYYYILRSYHFKFNSMTQLENKWNNIFFPICSIFFFHRIDSSGQRNFAEYDKKKKKQEQLVRWRGDGESETHIQIHTHAYFNTTSLSDNFEFINSHPKWGYQYRCVC